METRERRHDGNGDGRRYGNESSNGDENRDEDGNGNEDETGEGDEEAKKSCRRDQALSFRTHRIFCRQGMVLAGTRQPRSQGPLFVRAYRIEGVNRL